MTFDRLHRLATLGVIAAGLMAVHFSGEFPLWLTGTPLVAALAGWRTHPWFRSKKAVAGAGVMTAFAGVGALWLAFAGGDYLYWAIAFALMLGAVKSLMLRDDADFMQMYALSFLHVMAAAVINPGLSFGILMFPYVVLLVLGLMLTNLRRGIQEQASGRVGEAQGDPDAARRLQGALARRDLVHGGFVSVTVGVTLSVFLISLVFFFLFPRLGFGFFAQQSRRGMAISGFSEEVTLGDFGNIAEDPQVVMRVRAPGARPPLRMRGQSLDAYEGNTWRKTTTRRSQMTLDPEGRVRVGRPRAPIEGPDVVAQEIYLEPLAGTPRVLFGMSMPLAYQRPPNALEALRPARWRFFQDASGDVTLTGPEAVSIVYTAYSRSAPDDPARLRGAGRDYPQELAEVYLALPPQQAGVEALARAVAGDAATPYDAAVALVDHFHRNFRYTLDSEHGDLDPLANFLLTNREGHCEYFASGMVVLLRLLGIPARIVNGFAGGVYNEYGDYVALRRADAHSWVEAYFPGVGWATFEPTPPAFLDMRSGRGLLADLRDAIDAVQLAWYRWVVEYNLEKQIGFLASLFRLKRASTSGFSDGMGLTRNEIRELGRHLRDLPWRGVGLGLVAFLGLGLVSRWTLRRRRRASSALGDPADPAVAAYRQMRKELKRHGFVRASSETQLELAERVGRAVPGIRDAVRAVTWAYLKAVFGDRRAQGGPEVQVDAVRRGLRDRGARDSGRAP